MPRDSFDCFALLCRGDHVEVVSVDFDPIRISYPKLLDLFWEHHEPRRSFEGGNLKTGSDKHFNFQATGA